MSGLHDVVVTRSGDATLSGEQLETYSSKNASHGQAIVLAGGMLAGGGPTGGPFLVEKEEGESFDTSFGTAPGEPSQDYSGCSGLVVGVEAEDGIQTAALLLNVV
jgi:hypothetical protein